MSTDQDQLEQWLLSEFAVSLGAAVADRSGMRPETSFAVSSYASLAARPETLALSLRYWLPPLPGAVVMATSKAGAGLLGGYVDNAAGTEAALGEAPPDSPEGWEAAYADVVGAALSGWAGALATQVGQDVKPRPSEEPDGLLSGAFWGTVSITLDGAVFQLAVGLEPELVEALRELGPPGLDAGEVGVPQDGSGPLALPGARAGSDASRTFELLLEIELPVSISFGHAHVALKDVLKLTTGSIVELSRTIAEPVDVVVNNCVIARGEVVVVEGNFGVRIQQVASRNERMRSLE